MTKISSEFPNFNKAMQILAEGTPCRLNVDSDRALIYSMPLVVFKRKIADTEYELTGGLGSAFFSISTVTRNGKEAVTTKHLSDDVSVEAWHELINAQIVEHQYSTSHQKFLSPITREFILGPQQKTGCMLLLSGLMIFGLYLLLH